MSTDSRVRCCKVCAACEFDLDTRALALSEVQRELEEVKANQVTQRNKDDLAYLIQILDEIKLSQENDGKTSEKLGSLMKASDHLIAGFKFPKEAKVLLDAYQDLEAKLKDAVKFIEDNVKCLCSPEMLSGLDTEEKSCETCNLVHELKLRGENE